MIFKNIPNIKDNYFACDDGHIYKYGVQLKEYVGTRGYLIVNVRNSITDKLGVRPIHSLMCTAFSGLRPHKYDCSHIDGNKLNNLPSNLVWETRRDNNERKVIHGTDDHGVRHPKARLTLDQVKEVRQRLLNKEYHQDIANLFTVSRNVISGIHQNRTYIGQGELNATV